MNNETTRKAGIEELEQALVVLREMGGAHTIRRFLEGELVMVRPEILMKPVWKTIKVGLTKNLKSAFGRFYEDGYGCEFVNCDMWFMENQIPRMDRGEVDLVVMTTRELGFESTWISLADVCGRAKAIGLDVCHPEIAPRLRLQYLDQDENERVYVPIDTAVRLPSRASGEEWLPAAYSVHGLWGEKRLGMSSYERRTFPSRYLSSGQKWVFAKPRPEEIRQRALDRALASLAWEI